MKQLTLAGMVVTVLLVGCQSQTPNLTDADRATVETEIRGVRDAYFAAATGLDADATAAFWHRDLIHVSNEAIAPLTRDELAAAWEPLSHVEMDVTSDRVVALTRDSGYTLSTASYVVYDAAGTAVAGNSWAGTHIWVRTGEGWKVHAVHEGRPTQ